MGGTFIHLDLDAADAARRLRAGSSAPTARNGSASCSRRTSPTPTSSSPPRRSRVARRRCSSPPTWCGRCARDRSSSTSRPSPAATSRAAVAGRGCRGAHGRRRRHGDHRRHEGCRIDRCRPTPRACYAKNVANLLALMTHDGSVEPDFERRGRAGRLPHARRRGAASGDRRGARGRRCTRTRRTGRNPLMDGIALLTIIVLAVFVGFEVVSKVSSTLHTPLMSGANAIHGIILVGAIIVAGQADERLDARDRPARGGAGDREPGRRVRRDRPDARDVPRPQGEAGIRTDARPRCAERRRPVDDAPLPDLDRDPLPGRRRLLHPRPQGPELAEDGPPRQPDRRRSAR